MKIKAKDFIKGLDGKDILDLPIGHAVSNILLQTETGGKMKLYILAKKFYEQKEVEIDEADTSLVRQAIESTKVYNALVAGQLLVLLEESKK